MSTLDPIGALTRRGTHLPHPSPTTMRSLIVALALTLPLGLTACADDAVEEAYEEGAPAGDRADVIGDGEIIDEPGEPDADVLGDGLMTYDTDTDGMLSQAEYDAGINDGAFATYDTDGDGFLNDEEYRAYESTLNM